MTRSLAMGLVAGAVLAAAGCGAASPDHASPSSTTAPATPPPGTGGVDPTPALDTDLVTEASADGQGFGLLTDVRIAGRSGVDRIVFEFADAVPGYRIAYTDLPVFSDPVSKPVPLEGSSALQISLIGASAYAQVGDTEPVYRGPDRLRGANTVQVAELATLGDFERVLVWAAGMRQRTGFQVDTLDGPPWLVIDVAHG